MKTWLKSRKERGSLPVYVGEGGQIIITEPGINCSKSLIVHGIWHELEKSHWLLSSFSIPTPVRKKTAVHRKQENIVYKKFYQWQNLGWDSGVLFFVPRVEYTKLCKSFQMILHLHFHTSLLVALDEIWDSKS